MRTGSSGTAAGFSSESRSDIAMSDIWVNLAELANVDTVPIE